MGGGGTMRAAAKVAGFTVATSGRRVFTADRYPVSSIRAAGSAHAVEDVKMVASPPQGGVQRAAVSEIDDWIFTGVEEEVADPMPRVVFGGGGPTLQEAKEATSELADALEKVYLSSPKSIGHEGSSIADNSFCSSPSYSQVVENKACVTSDIIVKPSAPIHAIKAFKLLHESSAAQNIVASIACDPNVWNAVLKNQQLQEFLHSQKTSEYEGVPTDSDLLDESTPKSVDASSSYRDSDPDSGFMDFVQKIKSTVVDMLSSLSGFFQSFFGGNKVFVNSDGSARVSADTVMEASFMGLAVMAIMVILLKRA